MLRQAPNIILVGEIRDKEVAEVAIQAALTGHLVFSTLHTNDAPGAITRLIDMGVKAVSGGQFNSGGDGSAIDSQRFAPSAKWWIKSPTPIGCKIGRYYRARYTAIK